LKMVDKTPKTNDPCEIEELFKRVFVETGRVRKGSIQIRPQLLALKDSLKTDLRNPTTREAAIQKTYDLREATRAVIEELKGIESEKRERSKK
jgi:hypothetical protein